MAGDLIRTVVVEDFLPFRQFACSTLERAGSVRVIAAVGDGLEALEKIAELKPDLILLDISLPGLNGIDVARRARAVHSEAKILFLSQESSPDLLQAALDTGAMGYVVKIDAGKELVPAVEAILRGEIFLSRSLSQRVPTLSIIQQLA